MSGDARAANDHVPRAAGGFWALVGCAGCVASAVLAAALFLPHQCIWGDEATQLGGLALGPVDVVSWLAGRDPGGTERVVDRVRPDRAPPGGFWAGWLWSRLFGLSESEMRWFGVACVAAATALTFGTALRAFGLGPAIVAALVLGASPNVVVIAVEIRSYPLFLLFSTAVYYALVHLLVSPPPLRVRWLAAMTVFGLAAAYTHFYGLVMSGGAFLAALVVSYRRGESVRPLLVAIGAYAVLACGLLPFVLASTNASSSASAVDPSSKITGLVRLVYRLFAHPSIFVSTLAVGLALMGGLLALVGSALCASASATGARAKDVSVGLGITLASGLAVVLLAHVLQSGFNATASHYNIWVLPGLALLISMGVAAPRRWVRAVTWVGVAAILSADAYGAFQLARHGEQFAHGPQRPLKELIERLDPHRVTVVYDAAPVGEADVSAELWWSLLYELGPSLQQYASLVSSPDQIQKLDRGAGGVPVPLGAVSTEYIVIVRAVNVSTVGVRNNVKNGVQPIGPGPAAEALARSGRWALKDTLLFGGFVSAEVRVYRRIVSNN